MRADGTSPHGRRKAGAAGGIVSHPTTKFYQVSLILYFTEIRVMVPWKKVREYAQTDTANPASETKRVGRLLIAGRCFGRRPDVFR